jgi:hypothetical protein
MQMHYAKDHPTASSHVQGLPPRGRPTIRPQWRVVSCQWLFTFGRGSNYFAVTLPTQQDPCQQTQTLSSSELVEAQVHAALESGLSAVHQTEELIQAQGAPTEVSPWLELTQCGRYLQGYSFGQVFY